MRESEDDLRGQRPGIPGELQVIMKADMGAENLAETSERTSLHSTAESSLHRDLRPKQNNNNKKLAEN